MKPNKDYEIDAVVASVDKALAWLRIKMGKRRFDMYMHHIWGKHNK